MSEKPKIREIVVATKDGVGIYGVGLDGIVEIRDESGCGRDIYVLYDKNHSPLYRLINCPTVITYESHD